MKTQKRNAEADEDNETPSKRRRSMDNDRDTQEENIETPSKRRSSRGTRNNHVEDTNSTADKNHMSDAEAGSEDESVDKDGDVSQINTPSKTPMKSLKRVRNDVNGASPSPARSKVLFSTPKKSKDLANANDTPKLERNADRSARRKSTRTLLRNLLDNASDNDEEEEDIAEEIYGSDGEQGQDNEDAEDELAADTNDVLEIIKGSSAQEREPKGRPRAKRKSPSPDIPQDLPPHETYFAQNRSTRSKTSNATLSTLALLDHEEYFTLLRKHEDPHAKDIEVLQVVHAKSFSQWQFELHQNFSICVYGWGSKKSLLMKFADFVYNADSNHTNKIVIVNGYVPNITIRDVLNTVATAASEPGQKLGSQPAEMLDNLVALLEEDRSRHVTLIIHSIDRAPLRRLASQTILAQLSAHPQIHLIASADHPSFPLLWDSFLRSTFNFLFHDCTTFQPYTVEIDVVDDVHELVGRSGRRVGGKEGVSFVLKSLNDNSRNLFRVLVWEQLAAMDDDDGVLGGGEDDDGNGPSIGNPRKTEPGVEYRVLYHKAVEEFICSNEMNFRTLLKEFHDHQMIQSRKDALGTEFLSVPFRKEELETILEDMTA